MTRSGRSDAVVRRGLRLFGRLPPRLRRAAVRLWAPSFTVGAISVVVDGDRTLLVRQSYKRDWSAPGGLLNRGEHPHAAAVREVLEEVGLRIEATGEPVPIVWPELRRVDLAFACRLAAGAGADDAVASSPEIDEVRWFPLADLPPVQRGTAAALRRLGVLGDQPGELGG